MWTENDFKCRLEKIDLKTNYICKGGLKHLVLYQNLLILWFSIMIHEHHVTWTNC
jgi:hypothetical protein